MRILKVTQLYYPFLERGGPTVKVRAIARALRQSGHQVTVLTADLGGEAAKRLESAVPFRWGCRAEVDGIETIYLRAVARYRTLTINPRVIGFCRERLVDFDVVHIYGLYDLLGPAVAYSCRRRGLPYVVEPMGMFRPIVRNIGLKRLYHWLLGEGMMCGAQRLIATSEQERKELTEGGMPARKIIVRRNGIEVPAELPLTGTFRRRWGIPRETRVILYLGRLVAKKSPELLLKAFAGLQERSERPGAAILVIAGPDEGDGYRQRLEITVARQGLKGQVLFTGPLYDEAKWAAYRDADVFVLPSQSENFGNTAAEAIACGTPVVVTDRCGIAPLVGDRAGLVLPYDSSALEAGLARLLNDDTLRQGLKKGCAEVARTLTWDEPVAAMKALYLDLIA